MLQRHMATSVSIKSTRLESESGRSGKTLLQERGHERDSSRAAANLMRIGDWQDVRSPTESNSTSH
jgi:hypothetical protein